MTRVYKGTFDLQQMRHLIKEAMTATYQPESHSYLLERPELLPEAGGGKSILTNPAPFKALFVFGPAGAGKTFLKDNVIGMEPIKKTGKFKNLLARWETSNPDDLIEKIFPRFGISMTFANSQAGDDAALEAIEQQARGEAQMISREIEGEWLASGWPIIFDTTGEHPDKHIEKMQSLIMLGYEVAVFLVNVPTEASVDRDIDRGKIDPKTGEQKGRTVGPERTTKISTNFQKNVVDLEEYHVALENVDYATVLNDRVFNNIFDLNTGKLLTKPTVITPQMLPDNLNPQKNPDAFATETETITQVKNNLIAFIKKPLTNDGGKILQAGMRALVQHPGPPKGHPDFRTGEKDEKGKETEKGRQGYKPGTLGQNMSDLLYAVSKDYFQEPEIIAAANHLSALGGGDKTKSKGTQPYLQGSVRGEKKPKERLPTDTTLRDAGAMHRGRSGTIGATELPGASESMNYDNLVDMIREVITKKP